ncbi:germination protein YpeB [Desulfotomaculum copahuensis]|uniref:Germination protein YpeB n=1 Tax=Desulfotomaculum copahuensis TaxID=1838280 RepID=A0A1B7LBJ9_9FIRM|nr:germination protein YpeB [Desulfotomaculum copahuensis]
MRLWILPVAAAVLLLGGLGYWGQQQMTMRRQMETALNNKYHRSFYSLLENVQNTEVLLSKSLVAAAPAQDSRLFMELWQRANAAQADLSQLPLGDVQTGRTAKFLTQVGDYAHSMLLHVADGKAKSKEQWETLNRLYRQSSELNTELHGIEASIAGGRLYLSELSRQSGLGLQRQGPRLANDNFRTVEKHMQGFPTLIYDGPFSDHLENTPVQGVTGKVIDADQARSVAVKSVSRDPGTEYVVRRVSEGKGKIPFYRVEFSASPDRTGERVAVAVSRQGGHLMWLTDSRAPGKTTWSIPRAREAALRYLQQHGFQQMVPVYYMQMDGEAVFNFAGSQNGVVLYPDQVKVTVALDNGQVVGLEAAGYLVSHHRRELPRPVLSASAARAKLSPRLQRVSGGRLALIPVSGGGEKLTYEFRGDLGADTFLVYINALDGREDQVLRVVRNKEGILTL